VPEEKVRITEASRATYPESCLGLLRPDEVCAQALVEGFRIVAFPDISDTGRVRPFIYRSDLTGRNLRLENNFDAATPFGLPTEVADAVLQDASQRIGRPTSVLKIVQAQRRTWPNGCLGLNKPGVVCTQALVEGWVVVVNGPREVQLTYRTNESGSVVKFDPTATSTGDAFILKPVNIPTRELPPPLKQGELFRAIYSGGIAGRTTVITLHADGRLVQSLVAPDGGGTTSRTLIKRVSPQQLRSFQGLLKRPQFNQFNQLSYPAPRGAADFFTITLSSHKTSVRYADLIQERLPRDLQQVIQAFEQLTHKSRL